MQSDMQSCKFYSYRSCSACVNKPGDGVLDLHEQSGQQYGKGMEASGCASVSMSDIVPNLHRSIMFEDAEQSFHIENSLTPDSAWMLQLIERR